MRNRQEFENHVLALAEEKLAEKNKRRKALRRLSVTVGAGAAACICAVLAVFAISLQKKPSGEAVDSFSAEINNCGASGVPDGDTEMKQEHYLDGKDDEENFYSYAAEGGIPRAVSVYKNGCSYRISDVRAVSRISKMLEGLDPIKSGDVTTDSEASVIVELEYQDNVVTYRFDGEKVNVSGSGGFTISDDSMSELESLLDCFAPEGE